MDDAEVNRRLDTMQAEITVLTEFLAEAIAAIVLEEPRVRDGFDKNIARWEGRAVGNPGAERVMALVRMAADTMLASGRTNFPGPYDDDPRSKRQPPRPPQP